MIIDLRMGFILKRARSNVTFLIIDLCIFICLRLMVFDLRFIWLIQYILSNLGQRSEFSFV